MPKVNQSIETEVMDEKGNIVSKRANKTLSWGAEPSYIKLYIQDILYLADMPKKHNKILYELLKRASYAGDQDGMQVCLSSGLKRIIAKTLGYKKIQPIDNALYDLTKGKILYRIETGVYRFNPWLFGKGDWQDISRLRLEIDYNDIQGKTFKSVCEYKNDLTPEEIKQITDESEEAAKEDEVENINRERQIKIESKRICNEISNTDNAALGIDVEKELALLKAE